MERFRGDCKILEDVELVGSSLVLHWVRKWMLILASSNDSLFFLSWPEGTELLPTQGEHRDWRRFTGRHPRQKKKNQKVEWGCHTFRKFEKNGSKSIMLSCTPNCWKLPLCLTFPKQGKLSQMGNSDINEKLFSIYHLVSLAYLIVSLLDKIKLCTAGSRGCNQIAFINLINSNNKTDLKNGSIK